MSMRAYVDMKYPLPPSFTTLVDVLPLIQVIPALLSCSALLSIVCPTQGEEEKERRERERETRLQA